MLLNNNLKGFNNIDTEHISNFFNVNIIHLYILDKIGNFVMHCTVHTAHNTAQNAHCSGKQLSTS